MQPIPLSRAALVLALVCLSIPMAFADVLRDGTLKAVKGDVTLIRGEARQVARPGDALAQSDRIETGEDGAAAFALRDGTQIMISPRSQISLSKFQFEATTQEGSLFIDLVRGSLRMITGLIGKLHPEQVKITTPTLVVGVRGTDFIVEAQ